MGAQLLPFLVPENRYNGADFHPSAHLRSSRSGIVAVALPSAFICLSTLDDGTRTGSRGRGETQKLPPSNIIWSPNWAPRDAPAGTVLLFWASQKIKLALLYPGASRFLPQRNRQGGTVSIADLLSHPRGNHWRHANRLERLEVF
jgi:hypothetical protein